MTAQVLSCDSRYTDLRHMHMYRFSVHYNSNIDTQAQVLCLCQIYAFYKFGGVESKIRFQVEMFYKVMRNTQHGILRRNRQ